MTGMDLIDRNSLLKKWEPEEVRILCDFTSANPVRSVVDAAVTLARLIDSAPSVAAVQVVRCAKCRHWHAPYKDDMAYGLCNTLGKCTHRDWYCANGRKEVTPWHATR